MLKAVIFDFDYTLGDSTDGIVSCVNYAMERLGLPPKNEAEIRRTVGLSLKDTFAALTGRSSGEADAARFAEYFHRQADLVMVASTGLYSGSREVLRDLKRAGCRTGIVTTKRRFRIAQILEKHGISDLVDLVVGAEDVKIEKPDPEGLLRAAGQLGLEKDGLLYVGDSLVDARTAENAGIAFAGVLTGTTAAEDFAPWPHVFIGKDIRDIYRYISSRIGAQNC